MELLLYPMRYEERKYTYAQSAQLRAQTGSIGHLRGDFDSGGEGFFTTWEDHCPRRKTEQFQKELDRVVRELRTGETGLLSGRDGMRKFAEQYPESIMKEGYTEEYGFRGDTEQYSYLLRCNPRKGDYNFYLYCYEKELLDRHMERAAGDISFIDPEYNRLFSLPDGAALRITRRDGSTVLRTCRYIDSTHMEVGSRLYHICEFAQEMEAAGCTWEPAEPVLPPYCFGRSPDTGQTVMLLRYEKGCVPLRSETDPGSIRCLNRELGVSPAQQAAMEAGSVYGWDCPAARPRSSEEPKRPGKSREPER